MQFWRRHPRQTRTILSPAAAGSTGGDAANRSGMNGARLDSRDFADFLPLGGAAGAANGDGPGHRHGGRR